MSQANIRDLISRLSGQYNTLTIQRPYIEFAGSVEGGLFLSQLLYWADRAKEDGWFYKSYDAWKSEIFIGKKSIRSLATKFTGMGFLETQTKRSPAGTPTLHYRIDWDIFTAKFAEFLQAPTTEVELSIVPERTFDSAQRELSIVPEGTFDSAQRELSTYIHQLHTSTTPSTTASKSGAEKRMKVDDVLKVEVIQEQIPFTVKEAESTTKQTTKDHGERRGELDASAKLTKTACDRQTHALVCTARQDEDYKSFKRFYERISNVVGGNIGNGQAAEEEWMQLKAEGYDVGPAFWDGLDAFKAITIAKFRAEGKVVGFQGLRNFIRDRGWESALEAQAMRAEIEASGFKPEMQKSPGRQASETMKAMLASALEKVARGEM